jgi:5'-nucleotidase
MSENKAIKDLSGCRILLSNDDGITAPGMDILERIAGQLSDDVWVVAPATEQSGAGHSLTIHHPLRPVELSDRRFTVSGTPTDSVMVAVNHIMKDHPPDLVLSGVNFGGNLGEDVHYSGTVAAAMEGTLLGIPAIALSQVWRDMDNVRWGTAEYFAPNLIREICAAGWSEDVLINVNFPDRAPEDVKGVMPTEQGKHKLGDDLVLREDPRGRSYLWIGTQRISDPSAQGTDLKALDEGYISVTPLSVDLTHGATLANLRQLFPISNT